MFNEMKKVKNYYLKNLKLMKKNNSDTQKNQLNEKIDEIKATDIQKLRDEGKLNYTEKKQKQKIWHIFQTKNWKKKNDF